jgi:hypothetical protein
MMNNLCLSAISNTIYEKENELEPIWIDLFELFN